MKTSVCGIKLIKRWEGCSLEAYVCPAGVLTIGYGHTGPDVTKGMKITEQEAEALLARDLEKFEKQLDSLGLTFKQYQYDALVSFIYNVGFANFLNSTMLKKIKANATTKDISDEFHKWVYAGGKKLKGLVERRKDEAAMWWGCWRCR